MDHTYLTHNRPTRTRAVLAGQLHRTRRGAWERAPSSLRSGNEWLSQTRAHLTAYRALVFRLAKTRDAVLADLARQQVFGYFCYFAPSAPHSFGPN
ncbi:unnamed protein product [Penicillium manginii]